MKKKSSKRHFLLKRSKNKNPNIVKFKISKMFLEDLKKSLGSTIVT